MMRKFIFSSLLVASFSNIAYADIWGVQDLELLEKTREQLREIKKQVSFAKHAYEQAQLQYRNAQSQLETVKALKDANRGHHGFGDLNNKIKDLERLKWSADNWNDALDGKSSTPEYAKLIQDYRKNHSLSSKDLKNSALFEDKEIDAIEYTRKVAEASGVQSEYAYNDINKSIDRIHNLSEQIEKAETTKAALDLNSRLIAEVAYLQTQNIKAQTLVNQQLSQRQSLEIARGLKSSHFLIDPDENK